MNIFKTLLTGLILLISTIGFTQSKALEKANRHYQASEYAQAIPYFEEALQEKVTLPAQTKLAYCYRINNKLQQAEQLYKGIVQQKRAKPITYFYYAEALMGNEKYEAARSWLERYLVLNPEDEKANLMLLSLSQLQDITPYFEGVVLKSFHHNSEADDSSPISWKEGIIFSSDRSQGVKLLKQKSGWTGRDFLRLYYSKATSDSIGYAEPDAFASKLNALNRNTGSASITGDRKEIFFSRNGNHLSRKDAYNIQLYKAKAASRNRWKDVAVLPFCSPEYNYMHPAISPDGKTLFFVSDKPRGEGGTDIYYIERDENGKWGKIKDLGSVINTSYHEGFPFMDKNGKLYFSSKGHPGFGGFDIFVSERDTQGNWTTPVNLGKPINSSFDDISFFLKADQKSGLFSSSREGGDDDIYLFDLSVVRPESQGKSDWTENVLQSLEVNKRLVQPIPETKEEVVLTPIPVEIDTTLLEEFTTASTEVSETEERVPVKNSAPSDYSFTSDSVVTSDLSIIKEIEITEEPTTVKPVETTDPEVEPVMKIEPIVQAQSESSTVTSIVKEEIPTATADSQIEEEENKETVEHITKKERVALQENVPKKSSALYNLKIGLEKNEIKKNEPLPLRGLSFSQNTDELTNTMQQELLPLVEMMQQNSNLKIEIAAHTSTLLDAPTSQQLSHQQAKKVALYLASKGITPNRIVAMGYGKTQPLLPCAISMNCTTKQHQENQRLEIKVLAY